MRCPYCSCSTTSVKQTTRPIDEGLEVGDVKRRLRKCRGCSKNFSTFELHETFFRLPAPGRDKLSRQPLLMEESSHKTPRLAKWRRIKLDAKKN